MLALGLQPLLAPLDRHVYDALHGFLPSGGLDSKIAVVYTLTWPVGRDRLAHAVRRLDAAGAAGIGLDVLLDQVPADDPLRGPAPSQALADALSHARGAICASAIEPDGRVVPPVDAFLLGSTALGFVNPLRDVDGLVRRVKTEASTSRGRLAYLPAMLAARLRPGQPEVASVSAPSVLHVKYLQGLPLAAVSGGRVAAGSRARFERESGCFLSLADLEEGGALTDDSALAKLVGGKAVLVGCLALLENDTFSTPRLASGERALPGLLLHVNALHGLLTGERVHVLPPWGQVLLALLLACWPVVVVGVGAGVRRSRAGAGVSSATSSPPLTLEVAAVGLLLVGGPLAYVLLSSFVPFVGLLGAALVGSAGSRVALLGWRGALDLAAARLLGRSQVPATEVLTDLTRWCVLSEKREDKHRYTHRFWGDRPGALQDEPLRFGALAHHRQRVLESLGRLTRGRSPSTDAQLRALGDEVARGLVGKAVMARLQSLPGEFLLLELEAGEAGLPWELAHDGEGHLSTRFSMGRALLSGAHRTNLTTHSNDGGPLRLLLVGDPSPLAGAPGLAGLPAASREVREIAAMLGKPGISTRTQLECICLTGREATLTAIENVAASGPIDLFHFSGHALAEAACPERTGLAFPEGILTGDSVEVAFAGQVPRVVVLNACASLAGLESAGISPSALASGAFMAAGAAAVVGTLYRTEDSGAAAFSLEFYRGALAGQPLGRALRNARASAGADWGTSMAYVLYGDPRQCLVSEAANPLTVPTRPALDAPSRSQAQARAPGRYELRRLLGAGAVGEVWEAYDQSRGTLVALKMLLPDLMAHRDSRLRMVREVTALRRLSHPHVVGILDEHIEDSACFAMEYVQGGSLRERLTTQPAPGSAQLLRWLVEAARGLQACHDHGILHRDLKPANLLVGVDGHLKISDFGLARVADVTSITGAGLLLGTPDYMSPEQLDGSRLDCRTDLYSLGLVGYQLLTGRLPFAAGAIVQRCVQEADPPERWCPSMPATVAAFITRAVRRQRDERFQSAAEFIVALEDAARGLNASS